MTCPTLISWPWISNSPLMRVGRQSYFPCSHHLSIPPPSPSISEQDFILILSDDLASHITDKTDTVGKNFLDPHHTANSHIHSPFPSVITDKLFIILLCIALISHWHPHHEFSPLLNIINYLLEMCYFEKNKMLSWLYFFSNQDRVSSLAFTAKLLLKSCLYSQYLIHIPPFSLKPTLISVSSPPLHQNFSYQNHHWSPLY